MVWMCQRLQVRPQAFGEAMHTSQPAQKTGLTWHTAWRWLPRSHKWLSLYDVSICLQPVQLPLFIRWTMCTKTKALNDLVKYLGTLGLGKEAGALLAGRSAHEQH